MKNSRTIWIAAFVLLLWLLLSWYLGEWMNLHAPGIYYLRGGLSIIGIVGLVGFLILRPKTPDGFGAQTGVSAGEMDDNFKEAARRLQAAGVKQIAALPVVFFIGDTDSAKTSVVAKSDIAQLLSGQAQQDVAIVPTRSVNFWIAGQTVIVDPAGALLASADNRKRLFRRFSSVALRSVMGSKQLPARAVVFTVDCASILQKGAADALAAKARQFQTILAELAEQIGAGFPVYVLFTKADKISYFRDFVENLNDQEVADVFGITLPFEIQQGVYAQQQTARVTDAFQQLYISLSDHRPVYLAREHKAAVLPNIYEFPREFNKLRPILTSFLVDLCRPSQLGISPFLRGFYFTGIRPITVSDVAPASLQIAPEDSGIDTGATRMFTFRERGAPIAPEIREGGSRRTPQWVYLSNFLPGVILADGAANQQGSNVKLNLARRIMLAVVSAAALLLAAWWTISFVNNRALIHSALDAARGAPTEPSLDALQRLSKVKNTLETLNYFEEHGAPLSYGGFLYSGDQARESVRKTYYGLFRRFLLDPTQQRLVQVCTVPNEALGRSYSYTALKSYLITTQYHQYSTPEFLAPALLKHWAGDQPLERERQQLAEQNFEFYARELRKQNQYFPQTDPDKTAVQRCRDYLNGFGQTGRIYQNVLTDAAQGGKPLVFNTDYSGTEPFVENRFPVEPAFRVEGYKTFQTLLRSPKKYFSGDEWVLGEKSKEALDESTLVPQLQREYKDDFIKAWENYLKATVVRKPGTIQDAETKLDRLSGNRSPLFLALCVASVNTAVGDADIATAFQPVQYLTPPPGCEQALAGGASGQYMSKLLALEQVLKSVEKGKPDTYKAAQSAALDVETSVKNLALNFKGQNDQVVRDMLLRPIYAPATPADPGPGELAASMCEAIAPLLRKYPFSPAPAEDATLDELNKFLQQPEGILWKVVKDEKMKPYLTEMNDRFYPTADQQHPLRPQYLAFLNKAASLARLLYGRNAQTPGFTFTMKSVPSDIIDHVVLKVNGESLSADGHTSVAKEFSWPGNKAGVELSVQWAKNSRAAEFPVPPGIWGLWHFIDLAKEVPGNGAEFKWVQEAANGQPWTVEGKPEEIHFTLDSTAAQVLRPHYFAMTCVSKAN